MTDSIETSKAGPQGLSRTTSLILAAALFMEMMDSTIIATALPTIALDIGTNPVSLKLALTSYLVALAVFIPISGWLSDRVGARNLLTLAILVFILGSIACAFSNSLGSFVLSRFIQGMGGSMMTPVARILLVRSTPRDQLVSAMAWLAVPALMGPMMGPPIGGFLTSYLSWHWIFLVNIPIGILGIFMTRKFIPRLGIRRKTALDVVGFLLAGAAFSGIVFGLSVISLPALPPVFGVASTLIGLLAGIAYWRRASRHPSPILNPRIFSNNLFYRSIAGGFVFRLGIGATPFLIPLMLQIGYGLSPVESGLMTFAGALGAIAFKFIAQRYYSTLGLKRALITAILCAVAAMSVISFISPHGTAWLFLTVLFLAGISRSAFFTVATAMALSDVSDEETGQASALVSVAQNISLALAVAVAGTVLQVSSFVRDSGLEIVDFRIAVMFAALVSAFAVYFLWRMPNNADSILHPANPDKQQSVE